MALGLGPESSGQGNGDQLWVDDDEWGVCWDFRRRNWVAKWSSGDTWQPQDNSWRMEPVMSPWLPMAGGAGPRQFSMEGPYVGDAAPMMPYRGKGGRGRSQVLPDGPFVGDLPAMPGDFWMGGKSSWKGQTGRGAGHGTWQSSGKGSDQAVGIDHRWDGVHHQNTQWAPTDDRGAGGAVPSSTPASESSAANSRPPGHGSGAGFHHHLVETTSGGANRDSKGARGDRKWPEQDANYATVKEEVLSEIDKFLLQSRQSCLGRADFDSRVRQFLISLRVSGGVAKLRDALAMIHAYTSQKSRQSVTNWPAYLLTLLKNFAPDLVAKGRSKGKDRPLEGTGGASRPAYAAVLTAPAQTHATTSRTAPTGTSEALAKAPQHDGRRIQNDEVVPPPPCSNVSPASLGLPPGWEHGRGILLNEIRTSLEAASGGRALICPFTSKPLDVQATLVSQVALSLGSPAGATRNVSMLERYAAGVASARDFAECPRAAAAATVTGLPEITALGDDATAMDAASAAMTAARARPSATAAASTILEEISLELVAELLRNDRLGLDTGGSQVAGHENLDFAC